MAFTVQEIHMTSRDLEMLDDESVLSFAEADVEEVLPSRETKNSEGSGTVIHISDDELEFTHVDLVSDDGIGQTRLSSRGRRKGGEGLRDAVDVDMMEIEIGDREKIIPPTSFLTEQSSNSSNSSHQRGLDDYHNNIVAFLHESHPNVSKYEMRRILISTKYNVHDALNVLKAKFDESALDHDGLSAEQLSQVSGLHRVFSRHNKTTIVAALVDSEWDQDAAAATLVQNQPSTSEGNGDHEFDFDEEGNIQDHEMLEDAVQKEEEDRSDDCVVVFCDDALPAGGDHSTTTCGVKPLRERSSNIIQHISPTRQEFGETQIDSESWVRENALDKNGFIVTLNKSNYHTPLSEGSLINISDFRKRFEAEPEKAAGRHRLLVTKPVESRAFSMILQWVNDHYILLDDSHYKHCTNKVDGLLDFFQAAMTLHVDVNPIKGRSPGLDVLQQLEANLRQDRRALKSFHISRIFVTLKDETKAQPLRELFARSIVREYFSYKSIDDQIGADEAVIYDYNAGSAREGLAGRGFRFKAQIADIPELKRLFDKYFFPAFEGREYEKNKKAKRAFGWYFPDPLTGQMRHWFEL